MRVLLSTIGSRGDVQPLVALAVELNALGQDVHFCAPPDFRDWILGLGFTFTPIGPELRKMTAAAPSPAAGPIPPEARRRLAEGTVAAQFQAIAAAADGCDGIVAATALQIAARSVAEQRRIPYAFVAYCPNVLPSPRHAPPPLPPLPGEAPLPPGADNRDRWARDTARFNDLFGAALNAHRAAIGLDPVGDVRRHVFTEGPWLAADAALAPWPESSDDAVFQPGAWILQDDRPLGPELQSFLDRGDPPVYFGFGSIRATEDLASVMVGAARALGRRVIVSRGWANLELPDDGNDCLAIGEVNQQALFARVAAVVHHGGAGTTTVAALAGAPQVVIPQMYDQHYWAERVERLGIGAAHAAGAPTGDSLASALERALRPDVAARAGVFAGSVGREGARVAAQRLVEMLKMGSG